MEGGQEGNRRTGAEEDAWADAGSSPPSPPPSRRESAPLPSTLMQGQRRTLGLMQGVSPPPLHPHAGSQPPSPPPFP